MDFSNDYHIGLMFQRKTPGSTWESLVSKMIDGPLVHVDMLFVPPKAMSHETMQPRFETMKQLFSTFIGEHFCGYVPKGWKNRSNNTHTLIIIPVTEEIWDRARSYVSQLCAKKTPYNYSDLALCTVSNSMVNTIVKDVDVLPIPRTVFCSQAAILTLRHALNTSNLGEILRNVKSDVWSINSRGCSPMALFALLHGDSIVRKKSFRIDVDKYVQNGELVEWTHPSIPSVPSIQKNFSIHEDAEDVSDDEAGDEFDENEGVWISAPSKNAPKPV